MREYHMFQPIGALHGSPGLFSFSDERLLGTASALEVALGNAYRINLGAMTPAIGRFIDDRYFGGNPWYVTTAAFAELYYRVALAPEIYLC